MHTLYIKTHNQTGLQYLGYHGSGNSQKVKNYKGSGKYWKRHLKKHGNDVTTEVLCRASTSVERDGRLLAPKWFDDVCMAFSEMYDVVNNDNFANLCHETGSAHTVLGHKHTQETKNKLKTKATGKTHSQETKDVISKSKMGENNPKYDPNSIKEIFSRASEAGEYHRVYTSFYRASKNPNHKYHQLVLDLIEKYTVKE